MDRSGFDKLLEQYKNLLDKYEKLEAEKTKYYQQCLDEEIQINNLWRTLQEIKEIAELDVYIGQNNELIYSTSIKQILQKISDCEVNE